MKYLLLPFYKLAYRYQQHKARYYSDKADKYFLKAQVAMESIEDIRVRMKPLMKQGDPF